MAQMQSAIQRPYTVMGRCVSSAGLVTVKLNSQLDCEFIVNYWLAVECIESEPSVNDGL